MQGADPQLKREAMQFAQERLAPLAEGHMREIQVTLLIERRILLGYARSCALPLHIPKYRSISEYDRLENIALEWVFSAFVLS